MALVGRQGVGALTHRSVAAEAGVALAATTYYFESREQLVAEALEHTVRLDLERLEHEAPGLAGTPLTPRTLAERLAAFVQEWIRGDRPTLIAQYELSLAAARRPGLAEISRRWTEAYTRALAPPLAALGSSDPARDAEILLSLLDGLVLDELAAPRRDFESAVLRPAIERVVQGLVVLGQPA